VATIIDVARLAGVSTSTVSHVVNATRPVSSATRRKVMAAIEQTGYQQDAVARAMRRARTDSIGLIVSDVAQPVFAEMTRGIAQEATAAGLTLLLANSSEDAEVQARSVQVLTARRVDGLIVAPVGGSDPAELEALTEATPLVLMDRLGRAAIDQVGVENVRPMHDLVTHLIGHGHRRIALAAGDLRVATVAERRHGYAAALDEAGIVIDERYVLTGSGLAEDTRGLVRELLEQPDPPTAFVAASTESAVGVLEAAQDRGLEPPRDFAFAAFDGFPHADLFRPRVTTVTQPAFDIGATTMQLLLDRLAGRGSPHPRTIRLEPRITYRDSCGC
jgi:LacI family transcriptional regulator, galactose operon repressor